MLIPLHFGDTYQNPTNAHRLHVSFSSCLRTVDDLSILWSNKLFFLSDYSCPCIHCLMYSYFSTYLLLWVTVCLSLSGPVTLITTTNLRKIHRTARQKRKKLLESSLYRLSWNALRMRLMATSRRRSWTLSVVLWRRISDSALICTLSWMTETPSRYGHCWAEMCTCVKHVLHVNPKLLCNMYKIVQWG